MIRLILTQGDNRLGRRLGFLWNRTYGSDGLML